jgi:hypothetical protein
MTIASLTHVVTPGRQITENLIDQLAQRGVTEIELHATEAGENIYRTLGFTNPGSPELTLHTDTG